MKTVDFLDSVKTRHNITSDYALAQFLGTTKQNISNYRKHHTLGDSLAVVVAQKLDLDPGYVLACVQAERCTDATLAKVWLGLAKAAKKAGAAAACGILSVSFSGGPDATDSHIAGSVGDSISAFVQSTRYTS